MLTRLQFSVLTTLAAVAFVLMVVDMVLFTHNRTAQAEVAARAQYVQQAVQLQPLFQELVKGLADLAVRRGDDALRELLVSQGVQISGPGASPAGVPMVSPASPPGADPKGGPRK